MTAREAAQIAETIGETVVIVASLGLAAFFIWLVGR